VVLRAVLLVLLVALGFSLLRWTPLGEILNEEQVRAWAAQIRAVWWSPLALVGLYVVLAPLGAPMAPLLVAGAVFGPVNGSLYNLIGLFLGAAVSYGVARLLGREFVEHVAGKRMRRAERAFRKHGFWPLVQTRFLPFPFPVVNFGAALAGIGSVMFLAATFLGLVPSTLIHTYFIATLMEVDGDRRVGYLVAYGASFVVFNLLIGIPWLRSQWVRRRARDSQEVNTR
jgi:uncharacterized membrane protein YdjX (TVP38/TMEM64 family)